MPQRINMMLTMSKPTNNKSSSVTTYNQPLVQINTNTITNMNMNRVNVSRFNMNSILGAKGTSGG